MSRKKIDYENIYHTSTECIDDIAFTDKKNNTVMAMVASIPLHPTVYPEGNWFYVEVPIDKEALLANYNSGELQSYFVDNAETSGDLREDWIAFELEHDLISAEHGCERPYVFIDDISLEEENENCGDCGNCEANIGCIEPEFANWVDINSNSYFSILNIGNVSRLQLWVLSSNGQLMRTIDITNPAEEVIFDNRNDIGAPLSGGTYNYQLAVYNKCDFRVLTGDFEITGVTALPTLAQGEFLPDLTYLPFPRVIDGNCCGEILYLDNIVIDDNRHYKAQQIFVGPNVTMTSTANVIFHGQYLVEFDPSFSVEEGGVVTTIIRPECTNILTNTSGLQNPDDEIVGFEQITNQEDNSEEILQNNLNWSIFPNPSTGMINVHIEEPVNDGKLIIFNTLGQIVYQENITATLSQITLENPTKGLHLVKIVVDGKVYDKKILIH